MHGPLYWIAAAAVFNNKAMVDQKRRQYKLTLPAKERSHWIRRQALQDSPYSPCYVVASQVPRRVFEFLPTGFRRQHDAPAVVGAPVAFSPHSQPPALDSRTHDS